MSITSSNTLSLPARPPVAVPGPTGRRPWSTMLLREWAAVKYPGVLLQEQVRLGPTSASVVNMQLSPALEAALRVENWYADGLLITPSEVVCVEAKVASSPGAVGQVLFYQRLLVGTPQLTPYLALPFVACVLFAEKDDTVDQWARQMGVRVEIYTPSWIADYLTQVQFRRRTTLPSTP